MSELLFEVSRSFWGRWGIEAIFRASLPLTSPKKERKNSKWRSVNSKFSYMIQYVCSGLKSRIYYYKKLKCCCFFNLKFARNRLVPLRALLSQSLSWLLLFVWVLSFDSQLGGPIFLVWFWLWGFNNNKVTVVHKFIYYFVFFLIKIVLFSACNFVFVVLKIWLRKRARISNWRSSKTLIFHRNKSLTLEGLKLLEK